MANNLPFNTLIDAATSTVPGLLNAEGKLVLTRVARYCAARGHPVSQSTFQRHYTAAVRGEAGSDLDARTVEALHAVFSIPRSMLRGEPLDSGLKDALSRFDLPTLFLAEKIQKLPPKLRESILQHIEQLIVDHEERQKNIGLSHNVTPFTKKPKT